MGLVQLPNDGPHSYWFQQACVTVGRALVAAGAWDRAGALSELVDSADRQAELLTGLAEAATAAGAADRAIALAVRAEAVARTITGLYRPANTIDKAAVLARTLAAAGDIAGAESAAGRIIDPDVQGHALAELAEGRQPEQTRRLLARVFRLTRWTTPLEMKVPMESAVLDAVVGEFTCLLGAHSY